MKAKEFYSVGIYLRLSREDIVDGRHSMEERHSIKKARFERSGGSVIGEKTSQEKETSYDRAESNSIRSQRELVCSFVRRQKDMKIYDIYVDDGYSGANFDRPEFRRMMEDVQAGNVDCIVVKDLSRFGRDYIEAGRLIQKDFPALNVRFIAVTDHYDSLTADYNETSLVLPVKNFVNDSYCRDISCKVKSHQKVKREKGEFIGAFTVYGYCKSTVDKNKLVPDEYAAQIVRNIFAWKMDGMSSAAIADRLNETGILSPLEYKKSKGEKYTTGFAAGRKAQWSPVAVKRILENEIYIGTMVQGKREKINYKLDKCREKPEGEWIRVEGTHEPIIAKEDFDCVQRLLPMECRGPREGRKARIFSGLLFCGDCMEPMIRRVYRYKGTEKAQYICSKKNKGAGCTRHGIGEGELKDIVLRGLRSQAMLSMDEAKVLYRIQGMEIDFSELEQFGKEIARLRGEEEKYWSLRSGLYEDLKAGVITQEDFYSFRDIYEEQYARIQKAIQKQEETIRILFKSGVSGGVWLEKFKEVLELTELNREVLVTFIDRILVYEDKRICLELKNREVFSKILMLAEYDAAFPQVARNLSGDTDRGGKKRKASAANRREAI